MPAPLAVCPPQTVSLWTRDRVRLDADVYYPDAAGPFPVLLMRQPYGRKIASTVVYAHPSWYAAHGFIVVIQDVRGRGTSEGEFRLFEHEVEDGYDTVAWAAALPKSTGQVGMYGFSYQGMTQLFAAQAEPPALQAIAPAMVGYHPHADWAYENGALLLQAGLGWALQLAAETARLKGDGPGFQALYQASRQLPLTEDIAACPQVLQTHAPDSFFHDWLNHPTPDEYWQRLTPQLETVDLPMLHIGGWFDPYLRGDVRLYQELATRSQQPQWFWVGPWGHLPWGRSVGERDFGHAANSPIDRLQIEWFNHLLKGHPTDHQHALPVQLFVMGTNRWQGFETWPAGERQSWQISSNGLAAMHQEAGHLYPPTQPPPAPALPSLSVDTLVHDPWRPVPSLGGHAGIPAGPFNRASLDSRSDVLTYTSAPLTAALPVAGTIELVICCQCDRPTFDLSATLSELLPNGRVYPLTQGYGRFQRQEETWVPYTLTLQPTCFRLPPGHGLRLSLSAACWPAYGLNPGTGATAAHTRVQTAEIITLQIQGGSQSATQLRLPIWAG